MVRKTLMSLVTVLVLLGILASAPEAFAEVSKVSSSQQQIQVDSHLENLSLQEIIDNAEPGATIHLPSGIYHEVLTINKPLQIIGDEATRTIVSPTSPTNGYAIQVIAEGVILSNLEIMNHGDGLYTTGVKISARQYNHNELFVPRHPYRDSDLELTEHDLQLCIPRV